MNDYFEDDPTVTALSKTDLGMPIHLVAAHASEYALFELEIIGSKNHKNARWWIKLVY